MYLNSYEYKWYFIYVTAIVVLGLMAFNFVYIKLNLVNPIQQIQKLMENPDKNEIQGATTKLLDKENKQYRRTKLRIMAAQQDK